jgi:phosphate/sulfate permease
MTSACAISAISLAFIGFMVIWLAFDNPDPLMLEITLPVTFVIGWLQTRAAMTLEANKLSGYKMSKLQILKSTLLFWSYSDILEAEISDKSYGSYETALAFSTKASSQELDTKAQEKGLVIAVLKQAYRVMLIEAALTVSLAHGSNDVANSIAPLLVEMKVNTVNDEWAFWVGGAGIALGLLTLGYKVIQVVGKEVIVLDFYKGFACQFATANCIILGSKFGIPLSTTHCMVGSLFGIILCNKIPMVKVAYANLKENSLFEGD